MEGRLLWPVKRGWQAVCRRAAVRHTPFFTAAITTSAIEGEVPYGLQARYYRLPIELNLEVDTTILLGYVSNLECHGFTLV